MLKMNMSIVYTIINLLILYAFFRKFLFGRVEKILEQRREAIENAGKDLEQELAASREARERYEAQLKTLEEEKEATLAEWRGRGFEEYNRILENARVDAGKVIADARKDAATEMQITREKNQEAIREMVIDAASRISMRSADLDTDGALYDAFIREMNTDGETT